MEEYEEHDVYEEKQASSGLQKYIESDKGGGEEALCTVLFLELQTKNWECDTRTFLKRYIKEVSQR